MKHLSILTGIALTAALALTACAGGDPLSGGNGSASGSAGKQIIIGSADFTESQLIASIYSEALQARGVDVKEQFNIGSREVYMAALQDGSVDLVPEYSGSLLKFLDKKSKASTPGDVAKDLATSLPKGTSLLDVSEAQDKDVLAVRQETADNYKLTTISDLAPVADKLTLGGPPEWKTRINGVLGLKDVYGLTFKEFVSLDAGGPLTMTALTSDQIQVGDLFSTDPGLAANKLVALDDDKALFAAENVVPVITTAKSNATVKKALNAVSEKLTTDDLITMNGQAATGTNLADIAKAWLAQAGLN